MGSLEGGLIQLGLSGERPLYWIFEELELRTNLQNTVSQWQQA